MEVKRVETQDILNKLDSMTCLTEQIQAYNLLQEDYIDYIKNNNVKELRGIGEDKNPLITDALVLRELQRTHDAHILLSYEIDNKIKEINKHIQAIYKILTNKKESE